MVCASVRAVSRRSRSKSSQYVSDPAKNVLVNFGRKARSSDLAWIKLEAFVSAGLPRMTLN